MPVPPQILNLYLFVFYFLDVFETFARRLWRGRSEGKRFKDFRPPTFLIFWKLETFEKCDSQRFQCPNSDSDLAIYDNMPAGGRLINSEVLSPDLMNQISAKQGRESNNQNTLEQQERQRQYQIQADLELLTQKRDVTLQNNLERNKITYAPVQKPEVAIAVLVEGIIPQDQIQGGLTATPVAKDILQAYFDKQKQKLARLN